MGAKAKELYMKAHLTSGIIIPLAYAGVFQIMPDFWGAYYVGNLLYIFVIVALIISSGIFCRYNYLINPFYERQTSELTSKLVQGMVILLALHPHGLFAVYNVYVIIFLFLLCDLAVSNFSKFLYTRLPTLAETFCIILLAYAAMIVLTPMYQIDAMSNSFDELHVQSYISTIINFLHTGSLDRIEGQYGNYYLFFGLMGKFINLDVEAIFSTLKYIEWLIYLLIFLSLRNRAPNIIIPLIVTGALIYLIEIYRVDLDSYYYYQHYPHRLLIPVVGIFLFEFYGSRRFFSFVFIFIVLCLGVCWNIETAVLTLVAYSLTLLLRYHHAHGISGIFNSIKLLLDERKAVISVTMFCLPFCIGLFADRFTVSDNVVAYERYIKYFLLKRALFEKVQFSAIATLALVCAWCLLIQQPKQSCGAPTGRNYSSYFSCIYGLLISTYWYLNGSWIISIGFAIFVIISLGFYLVSIDYTDAVKSPLGYIGIQCLVVMFALFVYGSIVPRPPSVINPNMDRIQKIASVILSNTTIGQEVLILTDRNFLYMNNGLKIPGRFPSLTEMVSPAQLERYINSLKDVDTVIIDPMPAYNRGIGAYKTAIKDAVKSALTCKEIGFDVELCIR